MTAKFEIKVDWLDAPGIKTPELAATWARYEIWIAGRCVTQVESGSGNYRRSIFGSLYPLAEWIASNWWLLNSHVRPSSIDARYWIWRNLPEHLWLRSHNFRGAGDGMAWPDLTVVPEGAIVQFVWAPDIEAAHGRVRFASSGSAVVPAAEAQEALAAVVDLVIDRLSDSGVKRTRLVEEWTAVSNVDEDEREFCESVARLGLDPYSVDEVVAEEVVDVASRLPMEFLSSFFDSADVATLRDAANWTARALPLAIKATEKATNEILPLREAVAPVLTASAKNGARPWTTGYGMARQVRSELGIESAEKFNSSPWVGVEARAGSGGIPGVVAVESSRCGLVHGTSWNLASTKSFGRARALGRVLARPERASFVLSAARDYEESVARAFAAELLAPAAGIKSMLDVIGRTDYSTFDTVAAHYGVSPLVVRHQYDNQITSGWG